ncbi:unnamed protein product [Medioppia subpectinata]|uniref:Cytosolic fatty-acid binding proteins domain-containing protein n=1 Tax=Medioppia subpectinata TaxID=1979941 RepID=A0A7R9KD62_9ACAR|nr:unnamed protein product [Medioppia subpectinata]CAG2101259.1 unnamed protein product [Medioppia subpectinata]
MIRKYKQVSADNLAALLRHQGVPEEMVEKIASEKRDLTISKSGNTYTYQIISPNNTREITFELGTEFTESFPNGWNVKSVFTVDGNRLVRTVKGEKETTVVHELNGNELRVVSTSGPVVAVRTYARQKYKNFTGKFKLTSSDNFDALLRHLGVAEDYINKIKDQSQELEITKSGNGYSIKTTTASGTREQKFELGKEYTETFPNGGSAPSLVVADGNRLIQTLKTEKEMKIVREFNGNELRVTSTSGPVVAVRTYARQ